MENQKAYVTLFTAIFTLSQWSGTKSTISLRHACIIHIHTYKYVNHHKILILVCALLSCFSHVQLFAMLWTIACQTPLSMTFSRQEYWTGLPCPPTGVFLTQGSNPLLLHVSCIGRWVLDH